MRFVVLFDYLWIFDSFMSGSDVRNVICTASHLYIVLDVARTQQKLSFAFDTLIEMVKATRCHYLLFHSNRKWFGGNKTEKQKASKCERVWGFMRLRITQHRLIRCIASLEGVWKRNYEMIGNAIYEHTQKLYKHPHSEFSFPNFVVSFVCNVLPYRILNFPWNRCPRSQNWSILRYI